MKIGGGIPVGIDDLSQQKEDAGMKGTRERKDDRQKGDLEKPLPEEPEPIFLDLGTGENNEEANKDTGEISLGEPSKAMKPFPHRGEAKKKKDDPVDFMEIFGRLKINLPFLKH